MRRFLDDGTLDSSFAAYHDAFGVSDAPAALTLQADGRVVIAVNSGVGTDNDIVIARLDSDGVPDDSFGVAGVSVADAGRRSSVSGVVVTPDGRPFAVGSVWRNGHDVAGIFRYQDDASALGITTQGVVVDGFGGLHGWSAGCTTGPSGFVGGPYWFGWDIVRGISLSPDGSGGWIVDAYGGLHPFGTGGDPAPATTVGGPYWSGYPIARGVAALP